MDKNFISIDDLVRQRLGGGEENERAGAWLQMRDLLDQEMPQKRAGFIFWRRMFSAVAVLLLIASMSIGSYMFATSRNVYSNTYANNNNTGNDVNSSASPNQNNTNHNTSNNETNNTQQTASLNTTHNSNNSSSDKEKTNDQNNIKATTTVKQTNKQLLASNSATHKKHINKNREITGDRKFLTQLIAANEQSKQQALKEQQANDAAAQSSNIASDVPKNTTSFVASTAPVTKQHSDKAQKTAARNSAIASVAKASHKGIAKHRVNGINKDDIQNTNTGLASNSKSAIAANISNPSTSKTKTHSHSVAVNKTTGKNDVVPPGKLALGGNVTTTKSIAGVSHTNTLNAINNNTPSNPGISNNNKSTPAAVGKSSKGNGAALASSIVNNTSNTNKKLTGNNTTKQGATPKDVAQAKGNDNVITKDVATTEMDKKVTDPLKKTEHYERLRLSEHYVKTAKNEGYFKLDTISMETVNEELGLNNSSKNNSADHTTARNSKKKHTASTAPDSEEDGIAQAEDNSSAHTQPGSAKKSAATNAAEDNEASQSGTTSAILPAATTSSATAKSGMGLKENQAAKMTGKKSTAEKLSATFNDIKLNAASVQFAPGLTAGINGTFFGPNSFKGFQFGVTGNFMFGDNLSILTELKYFHRINNNYSLSDNYYTYTPVAGGQYSKEEHPVTYNFSTLHSFELPVSIRYCMGHFNFFAGGNLVYSFAINTGASTMTTGSNTPVLVSAPGTDNTPKIKADDFNSRLGLGYLFGISYQLSPNVMLDFRNVQTVWNNASSQGAKVISNQLYKSPSLQVSIGYRLGGKGKNKD